MAEGFYVSVVDGTRRGLLVGPFDDHEQAKEQVEPVRRFVTARNSWAAFYGFGTARVSGDGDLPQGRLNEHFPIGANA